MLVQCLIAHCAGLHRLLLIVPPFRVEDLHAIFLGLLQMNLCERHQSFRVFDVQSIRIELLVPVQSLATLALT